jgi:hypothetical protein
MTLRFFGAHKWREGKQTVNRGKFWSVDLSTAPYDAPEN